MSCLFWSHTREELNTLLSSQPDLLQEIRGELDEQLEMEEIREEGSDGNTMCTATRPHASNEVDEKRRNEGKPVSNNSSIVRTLFKDCEPIGSRKEDILHKTRTWGQGWGDDDEGGPAGDRTVPNEAASSASLEDVHAHRPCEEGEVATESVAENGSVTNDTEDRSVRGTQRSTNSVACQVQGTVKKVGSIEGKMVYLKRKSTDNWYLISKDGVLSQRKHARRKFETSVVTEAVKFMLHPNNVQMMAWGLFDCALMV